MDRIKELSIDTETFSDVDLAKCGVYRYCESPDFDIVLFGYSVNNGPVQVVDLASGEELPDDILGALTDNSVTKWAHNAAFERICLSRWLKKHYPERFRSYGAPDDHVGNYLDPAGWRCTMVWSAYMGLPLSLKDVGAILKLEDQKLAEGKDLVRYFCIPCKPTAANGGRTRNMPSDAPADWALFKKYNARDVEVEQSIRTKLAGHPVPESVWDEYHLSEEINDRGISIDRQLVDSAIEMDTRSREELMAAMQEITALENPNSAAQLKDWLCKCGMEIETLGKKEVAAMIKEAPPELRKVLSLRLQLSKSSVKKYQAMRNCVCADGRARGMFQFYGANRTGRFSGKLVQLQNLYRNDLPDLDYARALVRAGDYDAVQMLYEDVPDTLSQLIRTAFIAPEGEQFYVADFSAIEARVIAWLAGEKWRMVLFRNGGDIYCQSASQMFKVPVEKHGVNGHLRQKGKVAELACIAENSPVLTDHGLVPIQNVTKAMRVWDGEDWVHHDGVIYRGEREVITYDGLTATPDHLVWVEGKPWPVQFGVAAARSSHLIQTGDGGTAIRVGEDHFSRETMESKPESLLCSDKMYGMRIDTMAGSEQSSKTYFAGVPALLAAPSDPGMVVQAADSGEATMRKPTKSWLCQLWRKRHKILFSKRDRSGNVYDQAVRTSRSEDGDRQDRHKRGLRSGESSVCGSQNELHKSTQKRAFGILTGVLAVFSNGRSAETLTRIVTERDNSGCGNCSFGKTERLASDQRTARLYDIRNAGPHHRFTVSGKLVHNCGYGGSVGALKAMGALEMGLTEDELPLLVKAWRDSNPRIVQLWWDVDEAAREAVIMRSETTTHGLTFKCEKGMLFITLPSGRQLSYVKPKVGTNQFGSPSISYCGVDGTKKWNRIETFGGKLVENIIQAIARDVLCYAMTGMRNYKICAHVHDEVIIEAPPEVSLDEICALMGRTPPWAEGLILRADGYTTPWYCKKD